MIRSRLTYLAIVVAAFIFSQALYDSISLFTLAVVLLLPLVSLLCLLVSLALVKVQAVPAPARTKRMETVFMKILIESKTPLMLPMMKFHIVAASPAGDEAVPAHTVTHYRAFGKTLLEIPVRFNVRGIYKVGIEAVEFYDFLKLFRIKRRIGQASHLTVYPRNLRLEIPLKPRRQEQENSVTVGGRETKHGGDMSGIREFNEYDTLRSVHWKLSARLSKMIVKTYWENSCDNIMLLADLFPYEQDTLLNRRLTDGVAEVVLEISALLAEQGVRVSFGYPAYNNFLQLQSVTTPDEQLRAADTFAMTPMMDAGSFERTLHEVDFTALQGGALYIVSSMPPEELDKCLRPYLRGMNCDLQCFVLRPQEEASRGDHMRVMALDELEGGVII